MCEDHRLLRVFRHLEKKWKVILERSYELCLYPTQHSSQCYYEHTCNNLRIGDVYNKGYELVVMEYEWKGYESNKELVSDQQITSDIGFDVLQDPLNSSQEMTVDSFMSSSTLSGDIGLGSESDLSFLNLSLPSFDSPVSNKHH